MNKKILLIDEEALSIDPIIDRIKYDFDDVHPVHKRIGSEGLNELSNGAYDIIVLDMMLPIGDVEFEYETSGIMLYGITILKQIRKMVPEIPVICYTVVPEDDIESELRSNGAIYLHKLGQNSFDQLFDLFCKYLND